MPHENNMFPIASGIAMETMCAYLSSNYALTHWKCVLRCCAKYPHMDLPSPE